MLLPYPQLWEALALLFMIPCRFVYVWDTTSRRILYKLPGHAGSINEVAFHPDEPISKSALREKGNWGNLRKGALRVQRRRRTSVLCEFPCKQSLWVLLTVSPLFQAVGVRAMIHFLLNLKGSLVSLFLVLLCLLASVYDSVMFLNFSYKLQLNLHFIG